jgi:Ca2+-binding RTX toxin-like protein/subtilisin-like proprotein convertase family protein
MPWYTPHVAPTAYPDDPDYQQFAWHINRNVRNPYTNAIIDLDVNVQEVWPDYTGFGVTVGIYDDYVYAAHGDLAANYDSSLHLRINGQEIVPFRAGAVPTHGTMVAGIIAAVDNTTGSVGVAYDATIANVQIYGPNVPDTLAEYEAALQHQAAFDVVNHSWGYEPFEAVYDVWDPSNPFTTSAQWLLTQSYAYAAQEGRGGLGTIIVSAAGNNRVTRQQGGDWIPAGDVNTDSPHGASRHVIAVAAVALDGFVAQYSNPGANLLVSAPSAQNIVGDEGLTTTSYGVNTVGGNEYPYDVNRIFFGGTSAAAPVVSGVVALILDANPNLGWRDVKEILALSARNVGSANGQPANSGQDERDAWDFNGATNWNGGGMHFSHDYGFGLVDAHAAVRLAETWNETKTSDNEVSATAGIQQPGTVLIPQEALAQAPLIRTFEITDKIDLETITLTLDFSHPSISHLEVLLISPSGTVSQLLRVGTGEGEVINWSFSSNAFMGESSAGTWTLMVYDRGGTYGDRAVFRDATLDVYGSPDSNDDTYFFTNEFVTLGGDHDFFGGDFNGGHDTINAAAVTWDVTIDLDGGGFEIGGRSGSFSFGGSEPRSFYLIEDIITGDGDDTVTGNEANNYIRGMRGADTLKGMDGNDTLEGGLGVDTVEGGKGNDTLIVDRETLQFAVNFLDGGDDSDTLSFVRHVRSSGVTVDLSTGQYGSTRFINVENIIGTRGPDDLKGDSKANTLDGRGFADTMTGRGGDDTYIVDHAGDQAIEANGQGTDTVQSSVSFDMAGSYLENLILTGLGNINGTGNSLANTITGNAGNNTINGKSGADKMQGSLGNDTYVVDNAGDTAIEAKNQGIDTVQSSVSFDMAGSYLENLILTGTASINGAGNSLANTITGNAANNIIDGDTGIDRMVGGGGDDRYYVDNAGDVVVEASGSGTGNDRVVSTVSFNLAGQYIERLTLDGTGNINGTGNSLANTITGNAGSNVLNGGTGKDTLTGGGGADFFVFNTALNASTNVDTITDFNVAADTIRIDNAVFLGLSTGTLASTAFKANTTGNAGDASDRIIYETDTGRLYFDADGSGAGAKVHFATLDTGLALTNADFVVI